MTRFKYRWTNSLVIALALAFALLPLRVLVGGLGALLETYPLLLLVGAVGAAMAYFRLPRLAIWGAQVVVAGGYLALRGTLLSASSGMGELTTSGLQAVQSGVPPLEATPGVVWLALLIAATLALVVELLVNVLEQSAWAAAPLSLIFAVAAITMRPELSWVYLVPLLIGYCALLATTTGFGQDASGEAPHRIQRFVAKAALTGVCSLLAVSLALAVAPLVPTNSKQAWTSGDNTPIHLSDPTIRLNQDLKRPTDSAVLTYTTSNGEPTYLRTVAMSSLTTSGAQLVPMKLARYSMDSAYQYPGERLEVSVKMAEVTSEYLPVPFAVDSIDAEGGWSYDPLTMSVVASGAERAKQTVGLEYTAVSSAPSPSREEIQAAEAGQVDDEVTLQVPEGIDQAVYDLTENVVAGAPTAGEKALSIQSFLRSNEFTYSLEAPSAIGSDAITVFLMDERVGYCVHFASAMTTMARISGIPARMAVGFAPGERLADGSYQVTAHDAHAWVELYFEGLGWVPFEPTPAYAGNSDYTDPVAPTASPTPSATPSQSTSPSPEPSPTGKMSLEAPQTLSPEPGEEPVGNQGGTGSGALGLVLAVLGLLLGTAVLLALPFLIRRGLAVWRTRPKGSERATAESIWRETAALLDDYGYPLPAGTPGPAVLHITGFLSPEASAALRRIADNVERNRFAREAVPVDALAAQVNALRDALIERASKRDRIMALGWPRSLWRRLSLKPLLSRLRRA